MIKSCKIPYIEAINSSLLAEKKTNFGSVPRDSKRILFAFNDSIS